VNESSYYTDDFYSGQQSGSYQSAQVILPLINQVFQPKSVVDVGCGVGYWLKVWKDSFSVQDIQGIEGPYVTEVMLKIPKEYVVFQDLKQPLQVKRKFDLAMSLEVAEHLPPSHAEDFVRSLTELSDIILFSAAIEGQEGTFHHNEQMPEYWYRLFAAHGYVPVDYIRPKIWGNGKVEWWYQQNVLIYIKAERLKEFQEWERAHQETNPNYLVRIHPWLFRYKLEKIEKTSTFIGLLRWKLYPLKQKIKSLAKG
jgi:SAM-dependent methyltransferase